MQTDIIHAGRLEATGYYPYLDGQNRPDIIRVCTVRGDRILSVSGLLEATGYYPCLDG